MAEVTVNGYVVKNANDWFVQEQSMYLAIDSNWNLDPSTPDGLKLASDSEVWAILDEVGLQAYNSKDPNKASGADLETLLYLTTGDSKNLGTPSVVPVSVTGTDGTVIPFGSRVGSSDNDSRWTLDASVTISAGVGYGTASNVERGSIEAGAGTVTNIIDPVSGWQTVTNDSIATPGTNEETDAEIRTRRNKSVSKTGQNQIDTMISGLLTTEDVVDASIPENDTGTDDFYGNGLPANSIAVIVDGGTDLNVATTIYNEKSPGVMLYPANTPVVIEVTSEQTGNKKDITFSRPEYVDIVVAVSLVNDGSLPGNVEDLISTAIIEYAGGDLDVTGGFKDEGFRIGDDVSAGQLFTPVNSVVGQYGSSYASGITVNGTSVAIIEFNEKSRFTSSNITVTVT